MLDDDTIKRLSLKLALDMKKTFEADSEWLFAFANACYAEGQRDAQARIAELEREANEQARLLGISGSTEARLLARVGELERDAARYRWLADAEPFSARWQIVRMEWWRGKDGWEPIARDRLNAAIDAAMKEKRDES